MLSATRYAQHFDVTGDKTTHYGLFPCGARGPAVDRWDKHRVGLLLTPTPYQDVSMPASSRRSWAVWVGAVITCG